MLTFMTRARPCETATFCPEPRGRYSPAWLAMILSNATTGMPLHRNIPHSPDSPVADYSQLSSFHYSIQTGEKAEKKFSFEALYTPLNYTQQPPPSVDPYPEER